MLASEGHVDWKWTNYKDATSAYRKSQALLALRSLINGIIVEHADAGRDDRKQHWEGQLAAAEAAIASGDVTSFSFRLQ